MKSLKAFSGNLMSNLVRMLHACVKLCFQLMHLTSILIEIHCMYNFKFSFLLWGQLESLNLDRIFLASFKILPYYTNTSVLLGFLPLRKSICFHM